MRYKSKALSRIVEEIEDEPKYDEYDYIDDDESNLFAYIADTYKRNGGKPININDEKVMRGASRYGVPYDRQVILSAVFSLFINGQIDLKRVASRGNKILVWPTH